MALEAFDFTTTNGDRLDLIGSLTSHQDEIQTGAVEKRVVLVAQVLPLQRRRGLLLPRWV